MKVFRYLLGVLAFITIYSCGNEDDLVPGRVDFSDPYVITDDPNDPIQHRRYEIFQEYGVPVFFNDTIKSVFLRNDYYGTPIYQYETLDMNWNFTSHTGGQITYRYTYITDPAEQEEALDFAETYLSVASERMYPFALFLTAAVETDTDGQIESHEYLQSFRVLLISDVLGLTEEDMVSRSREMVNSMVLSRVQNNADVVARFGSVSSTDNYYERPWVNENGNGGLGCDVSSPQDWNWYGINGGLWNLFEDDWINMNYDPYGYYGLTMEQLIAYRTGVLEQIGQFGFICGDKNISAQSSPTVEYDLEFYVNEIMACGQEEFLNRYGMSPLVVEKFEILADFIVNELGVEL